MSALEIVLVSLLGALIIFVAIYLFVVHTNAINRLEIFEEVNKNAKPGKIVFLGDSLTDFFPIQDFFPGVKIYNRGIAGDTTKDILKRIDNVVALQPRKLFLQIGTNDLAKASSPRKIINNVKKIVSTFKKEVLNIEIICLSLYPVSHTKKFLSPLIVGLRTNKKIQKTNELLVELCAAEGLKYLDFYTLLKDKKGRLDRHYTVEGLHISGKGYAVIAKALQSHL
ncbi:MAG: GDSL-like Lipase/Acylhydrolase [Tenericutes bacterium ADurb.Bin087]|nr:MAG: GDSL-like Lipase/Acylhydrolase [Tenericutes bacterium ADurb.Bin087]